MEPTDKQTENWTERTDILNDRRKQRVSRDQDETDRQTEGQTERKTDIQKDRQKKLKDSHRDLQTAGPKDMD